MIEIITYVITLFFLLVGVILAFTESGTEEWDAIADGGDSMTVKNAVGIFMIMLSVMAIMAERRYYRDLETQTKCEAVAKSVEGKIVYDKTTCVIQDKDGKIIELRSGK